MAIAAYQMIDSLDIDQRYDLARIGIVTGITELTRAHADTILRSNPRHLLGLALAAAAARVDGDTSMERTVEQRLLAARATELARNLPEYHKHRTDIDDAVADAKAP